MIGEWIRFGVTALCVVGGLFALLTALLGLFRFDYALNRLHAAAIADTLALGLVLLFLLVACLRLLRQPLKLALRVLINSALGFCALWLLNLTTAVTGMSLGLNLFNALTIGVLGVPGLGLLLLLKWVLV